MGSDGNPSDHGWDESHSPCPAQNWTLSQGRQLRALFGGPAPARALGSNAGSWIGVGLMTDFPSQPLAVDWPDGMFDTGRVMAATTYVGPTPVVVSVVYGAAQSPTFRNPLGITQELLMAVSEAVVDRGSGPRCIMGDFNCNLLQFPVMDYWRSKGWQELQIQATLCIMASHVTPLAKERPSVTLYGVPLNFFGFGVVPLFGMIGFLIIRLSLVCSDFLV